MTQNHAYMLNLDGPLLRRQRELILRLGAAANRGLPYVPQAGEGALWEGLSSLLDEVADQAHDQHGIDCLLK